MIRLFISFYAILLGGVLAYQYMGDILADGLADWVVYDKTNDYIGTYYLLEQLSQALSAEEFRQVLENYPVTSNMPLAVFSDHQSSGLSPEQLSLLTEQQILVADPNDDLLYFQLENSSILARIGPMETYEPLLEAVDLYEQMLFLILAIIVFVWTANLHRKLRRLNSAATRLGEGDFSIRVSEQGRHKVGLLNHSFNLMAERIERLIQGHKNLTNAVAHELRTPVARVRFQLDMMYEEQNEAERKEYMYGISDDINELADLVDELLTFARFDREPPTLTLSSHSLHESLLNVIADRHFDSEMELTYDDSWRKACPEYERLAFEPKYLERAIGNLVSNAEKYARSKIQLSVLLTNDDCTICVEDDGPGVPEQDRTSIFDPFRRLDNSRTRATGGYGLGLAIVKQIAIWHGGKVSVGPSATGGARFTFCWPAKQGRQ